MRGFSQGIFAVLLIFLGISENTRADKVEAKIGHMPITDHLLLGIAHEQQGTSFKSLSLTTLKFTDWATLSEAVRSGSLDGALLLAPLAFQTKLKGTPIKIVLLGHRDGSALIVKSGETIKSPEDLKGTTIAIPSRFSTHNMLLHRYVTQAGLRYGTDFQTLDLAPPEMPSALAGRSIDGYIVAEPFGAKAEKLGVGKVLVLSSEIWKHHPDCLLVVREEFIVQHPEATLELVAALVRAGIFAESDRAAAANIGSRFLGHDEKLILHALTVPSTDRVTYYNLSPDKKELAELQDYMADNQGLFPKKVNLEELVDSSFAEKMYGAIPGQPESPQQKTAR
jgi:NitT/TauT family transport system substrate-binding protein